MRPTRFLDSAVNHIRPSLPNVIRKLFERGKFSGNSFHDPSDATRPTAATFVSLTQTTSLTPGEMSCRPGLPRLRTETG
jgi:hypothetical protein